MKIRVGILGYGNLGKGVELAIKNTNDMSLVAVFTRRDPASLNIITSDAEVVAYNELVDYANKIDVLIICGGSATDLPVQTPEAVKYFNVVDSFDTHKNIPAHFDNVNKNAKSSNKIGIISVGWDPGMFSLSRIYSEAVLPNGNDYTFWGKGVSQGHSDAVRRIDGVIDARQYTIPKEEALERVRSGDNPNLTTREKHLRECFVVADDNADKAEIERQIVNMPNYFSEYDTIVHFITMDEMKKNHSGLAHGGFVIRSGKTGANNEHNHVIEYSLRLDSNPEFTANVLVAYARAAYRMNLDGLCGCKTVADVAPAYISVHSAEELRREMI